MTAREQVITDSLKFGKAEDKAWRSILTQLIPLVYSVFIKRGLNPALAEDLTQQTIFDAVKSLRSYDAARGSLQQWIIGIAKHNLAMEMRRRAQAPEWASDLDAYLQAIDMKPLPDELLESKETVRVVRAAMEGLNSRHRCVLKMKYLSDLSAREIAEEMDMTIKAVNSLLYHAKQALRETLAQREPLYRKGPEQ
jgi:RNA polymerase sigma-70 factor, ECF subfamily